jgi:hypothetical protein
MSMNISSLPGSIVKFSNPKNGCDYEIAMAQKYLTLGENYTVLKTKIASYHTNVYLVEIPNVCFNSCFFENQ